MFYVYLLESEKYKQIYIGSTNDLYRRLREHNNGLEMSTRRYRPWRLVAYEAYQSEQDAREREKRLKSHGNAIKGLKKRAQRSFKNGAGFTLIEAVISVAIFAIALGAISGLVFVLYRNSSYAIQQSQAIWEAREGVEKMVREVREASSGEDGSFALEEANDNEFIFYADINRDGKTEKVRYFIAPAGGSEGTETQECSSSDKGGSCSASFSNFSTGEIESAEVKVSVDGDLNSSSETIDIFADGNLLGTLCTGHSCAQCKGDWQDPTTFDVTSLVDDNSVTFTAQASSKVNPICSGTSFKAKFELSWSEKVSSTEKYILKKGVIEPTGWPVQYPSENEKIYVISKNVMNNARGEPIFSYYDKDGNLLSLPARLEGTSFMHFKLIINVNPDRPPSDFVLESGVQIRNLKE